MRRIRRDALYVGLTAAALIGVGLPALLPGKVIASAAAAAGQNTEWRFYAGTLGATHYAPLDQINADNVKNLKVVWRVPASPPEVLKNGRPAPTGGNWEHTPLFVNGMLYMRSEVGPVVALDPLTGKTVWTDTKAGIGGRSRGISYW